MDFPESNVEFILQHEENARHNPITRVGFKMHESRPRLTRRCDNACTFFIWHMQRTAANANAHSAVAKDWAFTSFVELTHT